MQAKTSRTLINKKKLLAMIPLCERTIYNLEQRGEFPRRIALTSRNVAWDLAAVERWIATRKSSRIQAARPVMGASASLIRVHRTEREPGRAHGSRGRHTPRA